MCDGGQTSVPVKLIAVVDLIHGHNMSRVIIVRS